MLFSDDRRRQLLASLLELRASRLADNAQIQRGLIAVLEVLLDDTGDRAAVADPEFLLRGADLGR
ncbi:hypothetical protein [Phenylobacterium sp.]|uniref:hypothetical protein n=1 Tax=Phenylobacterium sp. TaxID=1871053 RepID=UPI001225DF45|nr:hypothetical protein [Phenylobacterium sp.]THD61535.1 MAG: hypothetical protein E8A49_11180 [Phenylobacterium sp.]